MLTCATMFVKTPTYPRTDKQVQLVYEQNDLPLHFMCVAKNATHALLKLATAYGKKNKYVKKRLVFR